jgi:hypothetical protein
LLPHRESLRLRGQKKGAALLSDHPGNGAEVPTVLCTRSGSDRAPPDSNRARPDPARMARSRGHRFGSSREPASPWLFALVLAARSPRPPTGSECPKEGRVPDVRQPTTYRRLIFGLAAASSDLPDDSAPPRRKGSAPQEKTTTATRKRGGIGLCPLAREVVGLLSPLRHRQVSQRRHDDRRGTSRGLACERRSGYIVTIEPQPKLRRFSL